MLLNYMLLLYTIVELYVVELWWRVGDLRIISVLHLSFFVHAMFTEHTNLNKKVNEI